MPLEIEAMPLLKVNYIFNECCFKRMSVSNATILEMLLSYFVFHQDKLYASFCRRMFHPPLLASNCFFASIKIGISIQLVAIANLNVTPATLLDLVEYTKRDWISYSCWQIRR